MEVENLKEQLLGKAEERTKPFNLDTAIIAAGDCGKYHILNLIFLSLVWFIIPSIPMMLPYFRMIPSYSCISYNNSGHVINAQHPCSLDEICSSSGTILMTQSDSLRTWAVDFDLKCDKSLYYGIFGSLYFTGVLVGNFFISLYTDKYGRKPVLVCLLFLYLIISLITLLANTYQILFIIFFFIGILYSGTSLCAFVLNFESSSRQRKSTFSTVLSMSYGIGAILHILLFYYFQSWKVTVFATSILTLILLLFTYHLQESPEFLYTNKRYDKLKSVLTYIAKANNREKELLQYLSSTNFEIMRSEKQETTEQEVCGIVQIVQMSEERPKLLMMSVNWFVMTLTFYGINFNVSNFGTNPYLTGVLVYVSEIIAQLSSLYFIINYGYKRTLIGSYLISAFGLIGITFTLSGNIIEFVMIFFAKFGISAVTSINYIFTADIFSTHIRVAGMSFCSLMSRFGGISSTMFIEVSDYAMLLFGILCLGNSLILLKIK